MTLTILFMLTKLKMGCYICRYSGWKYAKIIQVLLHIEMEGTREWILGIFSISRVLYSSMKRFPPGERAN